MTQPIIEPWPGHDRRLAAGAAGLLETFNEAGVLEAGDVHVAARVGDLGGETDESVLLAVALAVRGVRHGSVCIDITTVPELAGDLPWPDAVAWAAALAASPLVTAGAVRVEGTLVYLDRYHRLESQVCDDLLARVGAREVDERALAAALERVQRGHFSAEQRTATERACRQSTTVLTGGPGTGKTTTVARLLVLLADQARARGERFTYVLAAPTGKAATRLQEAVLGELDGLDAADRELVGRPESLTLHRLLGWRRDNATRFVHHRTNRLKYDLVVVDECSMVELTMMGRLLEAVRPEARLVLVGDRHQLTPVGAGAVLADIVAGFEGSSSSPVVSLTTNHRSTEDIKALAEALRAGDAADVVSVLRRGGREVEFVETAGVDDAAAALHHDAVTAALAVRVAAERGDAAAALDALDGHRLLCAHREGPYGVRHWNRQVERWLVERTEQPIYGEWYVGRPVLVTTNDYALDVYNGETGVAVAGGDGRLRVWIAGASGAADADRLRDYAPGRLDAVDTMHAMTIHKSQGSQAERVTVLLPDETSRLLTRELFYTAVTRAQQHVRVVGSEASVRAAVRQQAQRASGLAGRLAGARTTDERHGAETRSG
ncbi:exodeoxyribonuclease V subunit alpha [Nocardioides sp. C4-1]|uniref:exodeoxyribonuclease V subunit alpha n=1 Tax=Nocardioides sp. C4-1 TaxID=3151851 RepID=UPI003267FB16